MDLKPDDIVFPNNDMVFFNEGSGNVKLSSNEMSILSVDVNNFKLDDASFDEDDPEAKN